MQLIPLIKRFLFYIGLSLISFLITVVFDGIFREYRITYFIIFAFLIPHYIFGLIFLKTKWIFKLFVPFATAYASFGGLWLLVDILEQIDCSIMFESNMMFLVLLFPIAIVWEIVYQILKCKKKSAI